MIKKFTAFFCLTLLTLLPVFLSAEEPKQKRVPTPVEEAVSKTAQTAAKEAESVVREAHKAGKKFLQALINVMIAASPGKTRVYLPAPSSDPNSGVTMGVLPVFLFVNPREEIQHILAPSVTYNKTFGVNTTMRYYWYPHAGAQMFIIGSYAVETNRRITFRYEDPRFLKDWFYFKCDFTTQRDGSYRFFGFGSNSNFEKQTNYTLRNNHFQMLTGVNLWEKFRLILTHRYRLVDVIDGPIGNLPQISKFTPRPEGVFSPKTIAAQRLTFTFDTRDLTMAPREGYYAQIFAEKAGHMNADVGFERYGGELRGFHPLRNNRFITGWRFLAEGESGTNTPFYEQSLVGGKDSLRGFGDARFIDRNKIGFSLEERIRLYTLSAFNVNVDFELTPFYESGMVFHDIDSTRGADLHHVGGLGFRTVVRPNVVGIIDLGFSEQGTALFVGIDYPF